MLYKVAVLHERIDGIVFISPNLTPFYVLIYWCKPTDSSLMILIFECRAVLAVDKKEMILYDILEMRLYNARNPCARLADLLLHSLLMCG